MSAGWRAALACSVIGAAHQRRGQPCQDACLSISLAGGRLQLLAVADGHGSSRYWLSDVGSQLACAQAQAAVQALLPRTPLEDHQAWRALLNEQLPQRIQQGWLAAIEADWQQQPRRSEEPFSALSYGCTLGLVLLAPQWWGCTGLGDWDLVAVQADGQASLCSEESDGRSGGGSGSRGEATASLCLPQAAALMQQRSQLQQLSRESTLAGLVLSTDGVRKSCATDADFLNLCAQVLQLEDAAALRQGLAQITAEGSGDDVTLAMAQRQAATAPRRQHFQQPRWPGGTLGAGLLIAAAALLTAGTLLQLQRSRPAAPAAPATAAGPADPLLEQIQQESARLCQEPARIPAQLQARQRQFEAIAADPDLAQRWLHHASRDPLAALIAFSARQPLPLAGCPALRSALAQQWQEQQANKANKKAP